MRIIDFHTHIYPEKIAQKASESISRFYDLDTGLVGSAEVLLQRGREAGITDFVLLPVANTPYNVRSINSFIAQQQLEHNEFHGFGTVHVDMANMPDEIDYIISNDLNGVKLHPDSQRFNADDERLFPLYESIQGKLPVLIHCGDKRFDTSHPRRIANIIDKFPKLTVIAAHLGGWSVFSEAVEILQKRKCYVDISSCMEFLPKEKMLHYINGYGTDRVLFGSDFPLWDPVNVFREFEALDLSSDVQEMILYKNALNILQK